MDKQEIIELAARHELAIKDTVKINESGVDFRVAHVEDLDGARWILRIPRQKESMRHAAKEKHALDLMAQHVDVEVPEWTIFSPELIAYKQLSGVPAATIDMEIQGYVWALDEKNVSDAFYNSLGRALADLHSVDTTPFEQASMEKVAPADLQASMKARIEKVKEHFVIDDELWNRWQRWIQDDALWPTFVGLTHGDLHPGHILINENAEVTGMIDWTEVAITDVAIDFVAHYQLFGRDGLEKLVAAYVAAGGRTWPNMIEHIIAHDAKRALVVAEYALVSGLSDMRSMAESMLKGEM
ncbi:phosphotransferase [Paenalkalicoccus suaedae]|uniref:Phosphotransferase n=1 Tax=Paenalkalicoccus suaedae TaxID=2592382 RepID=A0A859FI37_9BACI|nr:macrolide 2'-phosphotransferase [Paenalkalicoccus suaedae]QKS72508.1 phosphotransferase [Paenalkalicoccus suaedae]